MRGLLFTLFFVVLSVGAYAQWANFSGPGNGSVNTLVFNGTELYAGVENHSVHKSTDFGKTWRGLYKGFGNTTNTWAAMSIRSLLFAGNKLFAGTYAQGLYVSTDKGETWVKNTSGVSSSATIRSMIQKDTLLFLGTAGVLRSTNGGTTWANPSSSFGNAVNQLLVAGGILFAATDAKGIRASTDNGVTWVARNNGITGDTNSFYFTSIVAKGNTLYCTGTTGTSGSGRIFKSTDLGLNWTNISGAASGFTCTKIHVTKNGLLFVGTNNKSCWKSTNDGGTWVKIDSLTQNPYILCFESYGDTIFAGGNSGLFAGSSGVFRSTDAGLKWRATYTQMAFSNIAVLTGKDNYMYCGTTGGNNSWAGGMYISSNYGLTWDYKGQGYTWYNVSAILPLGNVVLAGVSDNVARGISRSTDYGNTWAFSNTGLSTYPIVNRLILKGSTVVAALGDGGFNNHFGGVYFSTDQGVTWVKKNTGLPTEPDIKWVVLFGNTLFASNGGSQLYKSTDDGTSWSLVTVTGFPANVYPEKLYVYKDKIYVPTLYNGLFQSTDGASYTAANTGLSTGSDWYINSLAGSDTVLYAATSVKGVYRTSNQGQNWYPYSEGLPSGYAMQLYVSGPLIYCGGTLNAVWARYLFGPTFVESQSTAGPESFGLSQNYPNPFNPSTSIQYRAAGGEHVSLKVFDVLGNEVATLVNEVKPPGEYRVDFSGANLTSGVYIYKLQSGKVSLSRKMLFLK